MAETIVFDDVYFYNTLETGIVVPAVLRFNDMLPI